MAETTGRIPLWIIGTVTGIPVIVWLEDSTTVFSIAIFLDLSTTTPCLILFWDRGFLDFFLGTFSFSGSSGWIAGHGNQGDTSSEWFTYTEDFSYTEEESASSGRSRSTSSVNQPEQAGPSNAVPAPQPAAAPAAQQRNHLDQPNGEGGNPLDAEREARAQEEDARIYAAIEAITNACENEEATMVRRAHRILHERGLRLEDPEDVKRALQLALMTTGSTISMTVCGISVCSDATSNIALFSMEYFH
ncbi:uncharacterized ATP synthase C chain-like protein [Benincasa hispida]|uniref:uncharacterized ATP synthase C chain-like protein n=1 Tax=Benincasa hispida TaxID=102211 RepID=UPI0018FFEF70|nr:uncharacterized ATP synthase C chain-like protein [Benincasa hispida]